MIHENRIKKKEVDDNNLKEEPIKHAQKNQLSNKYIRKITWLTKSKLNDRNIISAIQTRVVLVESYRLCSTDLER